MRKGKEEAVVSSGFINFISPNLQGTILEMPIGMGQIKKEVKEFVAEHPETASLFECIGNVNQWENTRECVKAFEGQ
jgi:hypothetical protein